MMDGQACIDHHFASYKNIHDCVVDGDVTEMTSPGVASPEPEVVNRKPEMKGI
jgi:hypothetical protein